MKNKVKSRRTKIKYVEQSQNTQNKLHLYGTNAIARKQCNLQTVSVNKKLILFYKCFYKALLLISLLKIYTLFSKLNISTFFLGHLNYY